MRTSLREDRSEPGIVLFGLEVASTQRSFRRPCFRSSTASQRSQRRKGTRMHRDSERARRRPILLAGTQSILLLRPLGPSFWAKRLMKATPQPPLHGDVLCERRSSLLNAQINAQTIEGSEGAWTSCVCAIESSVLAHDVNQRTECPPHQRNSAPDKQGR
jgi:hypothetical protein